MSSRRTEPSRDCREWGALSASLCVCVIASRRTLVSGELDKTASKSDFIGDPVLCDSIVLYGANTLEVLEPGPGHIDDVLAGTYLPRSAQFKLLFLRLG